jgi:hypothetical protein
LEEIKSQEFKIHKKKSQHNFHHKNFNTIWKLQLEQLKLKALHPTKTNKKLSSLKKKSAK